MPTDPFNDTNVPLTEATVASKADVSWDSLFHTVGKGATQAAPGNHTHSYDELTGKVPVGEHSHSYDQITGKVPVGEHSHSYDQITGTIPANTIDHGSLANLEADKHPQYLKPDDQRRVLINNSDPLGLHNPGDSVVSLRSKNNNNVHSLEVYQGWNADPNVNGLAPIQIGGAVNDFSAVNVQWAHSAAEHNLFSGPHGAYPTYYNAGVDVWNPYPGGALVALNRQEPGMYKFWAMAYGYLDGIVSANAHMYFTIMAKWEDTGEPIEWRNGNVVFFSRLTASKESGRGRGSLIAHAWAPNTRPGVNIVYAGGARVNASETNCSVYQFGGNYRIAHEFLPYATGEAGLAAGWRDF